MSTWRSIALAALFTASACGGNSTSWPNGINYCPEFTPCSGDLTGTWLLVAQCLTENIKTNDPLCAGETSSFSELARSLITFGSDGSYTATSSGETTQTETFSAETACFTTEQDCEAYSQPETNGSRIDCSLQDGCVCVTVSNEVSNQNYTWAGSDGTYTLTTMLNGNTLTAHGAYCVDGRTLILSPQSPHSIVRVYKRI